MPLTLVQAYEILGVNKNSTEAEVKSAYKKLALKTHPDKNPDDPDASRKFRDVSEAYTRITDPASLEDDACGHHGSPFDDEMMFDLFHMMMMDMMMGGMRGGRGMGGRGGFPGMGGMGGGRGGIPMFFHMGPRGGARGFSFSPHDFYDDEDDEEDDYDEDDDDDDEEDDEEAFRRYIAGMRGGPKSARGHVPVEKPPRRPYDPAEEARLRAAAMASFDSSPDYNGGSRGGQGVGSGKSKNKKSKEKERERRKRKAAEDRARAEAASKRAEETSKQGVDDEEDWETESSDDEFLEFLKEQLSSSSAKAKKPAEKAPPTVKIPEKAPPKQERAPPPQQSKAQEKSFAVPPPKQESASHQAPQTKQQEKVTSAPPATAPSKQSVVPPKQTKAPLQSKAVPKAVEDPSTWTCPGCKTVNEADCIMCKEGCMHLNPRERDVEVPLQMNIGGVPAKSTPPGKQTSASAPKQAPAGPSKSTAAPTTKQAPIAPPTAPLYTRRDDGPPPLRVSKETPRPFAFNVASQTAATLPEPDDFIIGVGDTVGVIGQDNIVGRVAYIGEVHYCKGIFCGLVVSSTVGKNNGTVKGVEYFSASINSGLMVKLEEVRKIRKL